jgi:aspartate 1-decarboxylase
MFVVLGQRASRCCTVSTLAARCLDVDRSVWIQHYTHSYVMCLSTDAVLCLPLKAICCAVADLKSELLQ